LFNELRFGINRTTASTLTIDTQSGSLHFAGANRQFGMLNIAGMSLIGNSPGMPLGDFSTVYQVQDQLARNRGRHSLKFGGEFREDQVNGYLDYTV